MKLGIIIYSNDPETVWNAFRFSNFALGKGDEVNVFLLGKGVECESISPKKFDVRKEIERFLDKGGKIFACGTCLKIRNQEKSEICPISTMEDMYSIVKECEKILTF